MSSELSLTSEINSTICFGSDGLCTLHHVLSQHICNQLRQLGSILASFTAACVRIRLIKTSYILSTGPKPTKLHPGAVSRCALHGDMTFLFRGCKQVKSVSQHHIRNGMRRQEVDAPLHVQHDSPEIGLHVNKLYQWNAQVPASHLTSRDQVLNWLCYVGQSLYVHSF